jgi:predicted nucleotidyltransferase
MQTDEQEQEKNKVDLGDRVQEKRDQILQIAARHGAYNVRVFGSTARGTARPDSDLDILVDVGPAHSAWFPAGLILDLEALLECEVDVVTPDALHWYICDRVLAEAVPL